MKNNLITLVCGAQKRKPLPRPEKRINVEKQSPTRSERRKKMSHTAVARGFYCGHVALRAFAASLVVALWSSIRPMAAPIQDFNQRNECNLRLTNPHLTQTALSGLIPPSMPASIPRTAQTNLLYAKTLQYPLVGNIARAPSARLLRSHDT